MEQRKRLTIAVELVANPSIVFMDEPTSGLDARAAAIVMRAVRNTVDTGRTVVRPRPRPRLPPLDPSPLEEEEAQVRTAELSWTASGLPWPHDCLTRETRGPGGYRGLKAGVRGSPAAPLYVGQGALPPPVLACVTPQ